MRRTVHTAPGLPGLRLLQRPSSIDHHGGRLILRLFAEISALFHLCESQ
jgi:hypothetical protein